MVFRINDHFSLKKILMYQIRYGWTLTVDEDYTVGKIVFVFYSIIQAVSSLGNGVPFIANLGFFLITEFNYQIAI